MATPERNTKLERAGRKRQGAIKRRAVKQFHSKVQGENFFNKVIKGK